MAAVLALTAVGLCLVFGVMRVVNVAHGEFFMLGAVVAWSVAAAWSPAPPPLGFLAALVVSPLVAALIAVAPRPPRPPPPRLRARGGDRRDDRLRLRPAAGRALASTAPRRAPSPPRSTSASSSPGSATPATSSRSSPSPPSSSPRSGCSSPARRIGLVMRATQWDRETATAFGIDIDRVYALVFGLGAGLAALAAVLDRADPARPTT